ncbi:hypothetical protein ACFQ2B_30485 [Streptomyces stramineus]|uniref:Uncharacterized protein n=1 Tax=Streptomyces stramineus TaxID=173861 RepID=A0ABP3JGS3_9ACTN
MTCGRERPARAPVAGGARSGACRSSFTTPGEGFGGGAAGIRKDTGTGRRGGDRGRNPTTDREVAMVWWGWLIAVIAVLLVAAAVTAGIQARRRAGTVIAVQRGRRPGTGGGTP